MNETKQRLQEQQIMIENRWIQQVTDEIRGNIRTDRYRLVWRRLNQLKEPPGTAKQRNLELRNQAGK